MRRVKKEVNPGIKDIIPAEHVSTVAQAVIEKLEVPIDELISINNKLYNEDILLPISIFESDLSPLETISKYLVEECNLTCAKIGRLIKRNHSSIWNAYKDANSKLPAQMPKKNSKYAIPLKVFSSQKLSAMEALVHYMKSTYNLKFSEIGKLTHRNERTIWTSYDRAKKKLG